MPRLSINPLGAPILNPYVTGVTWRRQELLCAAQPHSWGQPCTCRALSRNILNTEEIQYSVHRAQEPLTGWMLEQVRRWCFMRQPFILKSEVKRQLKPQLTIFILFLTFLLCPHWVIPTPASQHARFAAERSLPQSLGRYSGWWKGSSLQVVFLLCNKHGQPLGARRGSLLWTFRYLTRGTEWSPSSPAPTASGCPCFPKPSKSCHLQTKILLGTVHLSWTASVTWNCGFKWLYLKKWQHFASFSFPKFR